LIARHEHQVRRVGEVLYPATAIAELSARLVALVDEHHARAPLDDGVPLQMVRAKLGVHSALVDLILEEQSRAGTLEITGALVRRRGWKPELTPEQERVRALRRAAAEAYQAGLARATGQVLARLGDTFFGWVRRARIRAELESLTDHELADIGLTRSDIDRVVSGADSAKAPEPRRPARPAGIPVPRPA
jgi:uncharacterized protein YjiS (DUF1127 family)